MRAWLDDLLAGDDDFGVPATVWGSFLRLATNRRIFEVPTPIADAFEFINAVVAQPRYQNIGPGPRHLALLRRLCQDAEAVGDLVPDSVLGALVVEHGAMVVTLDRDFARFEGVRHLRPEL